MRRILMSHLAHANAWVPFTVPAAQHTLDIIARRMYTQELRLNDATQAVVMALPTDCEQYDHHTFYTVLAVRVTADNSLWRMAPEYETITVAQVWGWRGDSDDVLDFSCNRSHELEREAWQDVAADRVVCWGIPDAPACKWQTTSCYVQQAHGGAPDDTDCLQCRDARFHVNMTRDEVPPSARIIGSTTRMHLRLAPKLYCTVSLGGGVYVNLKHTDGTNIHLEEDATLLLQMSKWHDAYKDGAAQVNVYKGLTSVYEHRRAAYYLDKTVYLVPAAIHDGMRWVGSNSVCDLIKTDLIDYGPARRRVYATRGFKDVTDNGWVARATDILQQLRRVVVAAAGDVELPHDMVPMEHASPRVLEPLSTIVERVTAACASPDAVALFAAAAALMHDTDISNAEVAALFPRVHLSAAAIAARDAAAAWARGDAPPPVIMMLYDEDFVEIRTPMGRGFVLYGVSRETADCMVRTLWTDRVVFVLTEADDRIDVGKGDDCTDVGKGDDCTDVDEDDDRVEVDEGDRVPPRPIATDGSMVRLHADGSRTVVTEGAIDAWCTEGAPPYV